MTALNQEVKDVEDRGRMKITSQATLEQAIEARKFLRQVREGVEAKRLAMTNPINQALKEIRSFFKPYEERIETVDSWLSGQLVDWQQKQIAEEAKKKAEIEQKIAEGKMTLEQASKKVEKVEEKVKAIPVRKAQVLRITDETKLAREYLMPDEGKIMIALKKGIKVDGAELFEKIIPVNYR